MNMVRIITKQAKPVGRPRKHASEDARHDAIKTSKREHWRGKYGKKIISWNEAESLLRETVIKVKRLSEDVYDIKMKLWQMTGIGELNRREAQPPPCGKEE